MASLSPLKYGKVVGRFLANIADGPDIEDLPEFPPLAGTITFTAQAPKVLVATAVPDPATYVQLPAHYKVSLDEFGYITWRGDRGVRLVAPTADTTNPSDWTWRVTFDLNYEGVSVAIAPFNIEVPEYEPGPDEEDPDEGSSGLVDLTLVSPVPASEGEAVVRGLSIVGVSLVGDALVFELDNGEELDPVTVPQIEEATDAAAEAAASESAAAASATAAQVAVDSFDLVVGTITTGAPGDPASVTITGGPIYTMDAVIPEGEPGDTGPAGSNAWGDITGKPSTFPPTIGSGSGDAVAGDDSRLTDARTPTSHTHPASEISNSTTIGRSVLTAADAAAVRTAISAVSTGDSRLTDTRTPSANTVPSDFVFVAVSPATTRAVGSGDWTVGLYVGRAFTLTKAVYQFETADASGNTTVEVRRNGAQVTSSNLTISAANQADGTGTDSARTAASISQSFAVGDRIGGQITAVGTTPGKGLKIYLFGTWN